MTIRKWLMALALLATVAVMWTMSARAQTNSPDVQTPALTAAQLASLDNSVQSLLPLVPVQYKGLIVTALLGLSLLSHLGRVIVGWKKGGFWGALSGMFVGTNTPVNNDPNGNQTQAKPAGGLRTLVLLALLLPVVALTGCRSQVVEAASGSGFKAAVTVPIPYSGGETLLGMSVTVGAWKTGTVVQPTNSQVTVVQLTDGAQTLNGNAAANATAGIVATEHDVNALTTGTGTTATVTNGAATLNK